MLLPMLALVAADRERGMFAYFIGTGLCYAALFKAGRHDELLTLLEAKPHAIWSYAVWDGRVHAARGDIDGAIAYMKRKAGINTPIGAMARFGEEILRDAGRSAEAYGHYAIEANQANSRIATYRAIAKKYPEVEPDRLLADLIESTPGEEGKWFATAKARKRFDLALRLARLSPCDPKTLTRAARDHLTSQPEFAANTALAALYRIAKGHGYEIAALDVQHAYEHAIQASQRLGKADQVEQQVRELLAADGPTTKWMRQALGWAIAPTR